MGAEWHWFAVRVYYEDTDAQGVVYYANYLRFMERGRTEWLRAHGVEQDRLQVEQGLCFSIVDAQLRFHLPARFNDELLVGTLLVDCQRVRFVIDQEVRRARDRALLASARYTAACLDVATFRPRRMPPGLLPQADENQADFSAGENR
ncbi:MAG: tol-pal system-associated acyl-CoA thioesterase [Gammaproteobacteria bacterium]|jgi:acyl-CoA thioester hydrolase|nr:tol-pal system-associated acyl-CoA thioesterase [Gammaproteobacteria bacterium]